MRIIVLFFILGSALPASYAGAAEAQAVGGTDKARPVAGDPGMSTMLVMDQPQFRVLRDFAEPGAVRRMHSHDDATWHVFVLVTGQLLLTVEGETPVEVTQGQVLSLKGGVKHTFKNTGTVAATIVEVFGKAPAGGADQDGLVSAALGIACGLRSPGSNRDCQ
ncbi:MAG TPA: cupin domain-containing protein [Vicinamibacterales bacterium]|nr:cupin domain-containing protein [Vicinamibacterales bacterium]